MTESYVVTSYFAVVDMEGHLEVHVEQAEERHHVTTLESLDFRRGEASKHAEAILEAAGYRPVGDWDFTSEGFCTTLVRISI